MFARGREFGFLERFVLPVLRFAAAIRVSGKKQGDISLLSDPLGCGASNPVRPLVLFAASSGAVAWSCTAPHARRHMLPGCTIGVMNALRSFTPTRCEGVLVHA